MPKVNPSIESFARIIVIGVGGSGKNAVNHMIQSKVKGVTFISLNTDTQDLHNSLAEKKIHIGKNLTRGLGAGMDPDVGKKAAEETKAEIQDAIKGADMVFIACGMGGGTGTGAAPIISKVAKEQGILTVAVVTKPFSFEGNNRGKIAEKGIEELSKEVDAIVIIPNDKLLNLQEKNMNFRDAFASCDDVLKQAVEGITDLITIPGIINVDFADIRTIMSNSGSALMGLSVASGEDRAKKAAMQAINSPLLEISIAGAKGVLFAVSGGEDVGINEIQEIAKIITESIDKDAKVIFGTIHDEKLKKGEIKVTVIATNFSSDRNTNVNNILFSNNFNNNLSNKDRKNKEKDTTSTPIISNNNNADFTSSYDYIKKSQNKKENDNEETIIIEDQESDWSAVPAFLRRKK